MSTPRTLRLSPNDNVVVAIDQVAVGAEVAGVTARERVPRGHKLAIGAIGEGEPVTKYGQIIGFAAKPIAPGDWVHEHNVALHDFARDYRFAEGAKNDEVLPPELRATFEGYVRPNGRTGTRNYIGILTSVNCSASVAKFIAEAVNRSGMLDDYPEIDGAVAFVHGTGCGMASRGEGYEVLQRTQWGYATHPNLGASQGDHFQSMTIQATGGTRKTIAQGLARIKEMLPVAARAKRETRPASEVVLALQCGGSDGYSGITANPALGAAVDLLVKHGGTGVLAETPEIYGAEHLLTRRAVNRAVGEKLVERIRWWEDYTERNRGEMNNNPSPGNKAGGLTTILEKSLGAAAKGGTTTMRAVYEYAQPIKEKGFVFMDTPGYDPVGATGQVAGGSNVMCFTTGRGSAFGCKPTPSIKLATNRYVYESMVEDMDINCGDVLDGVSLEAKGQEILDKVLKVASGERTKSEGLGYGDLEFVPWQIGATM
ncbi:MAG: altronate dehydratase [Rhizobiales bacterium]|nr:altronate dehydratase [Hyphomicrobiales bacterium]